MAHVLYHIGMGRLSTYKLTGKTRRPDLIGNDRGFKKGKHPWNYGKKNVYKKEALEAMRQKKLGGKLTEEHKKKISWKGRHHTEETKRKLSLLHIGELNPAKRPEVRAKMSAVASTSETISKKERGMIYSGTKIELVVRAELTAHGIPFIPNHQLLKKYNVDIFIEPNIVVECDGDYWHNLERVKIKDLRRDKTLREAGYVIHRFWEHEIKKDVSACIIKVLA